MARTFRDRRDAGRVLGRELASYRGRDGLLVLGLARGGVPVGWEVAAALGAELDVFLVRKLGVPQWPELAMGALASGGGVVMNDRVLSSLQISDEQVRDVIERETAELRRRELAYRDGRTMADPRGRTVIIVDDGIATGASILAAVRALRAAGPAAIIVAVPVGPAVGLPTTGPGSRRRGVRDDAGRFRGGRSGFRRLPSGQRRRGPRSAGDAGRRQLLTGAVVVADAVAGGTLGIWMRRSGIALLDGVGVVGGIFVVVESAVSRSGAAGPASRRCRSCSASMISSTTPNTLAPMQTQATNSLLVMTAKTSAARPITASTSEIISTG